MSANTEVLVPKHAVAMRDAPSTARRGGAEVKVPHRESFPVLPKLLVVARTAAVVLIAALVIACLIVAFGIAECRTAWSRGRMPHTD
jgi:hypothetical protein